MLHAVGANQWSEQEIEEARYYREYELRLLSSTGVCNKDYDVHDNAGMPLESKLLSLYLKVVSR
jgi:hypothetical protein